MKTFLCQGSRFFSLAIPLLAMAFPAVRAEAQQAPQDPCHYPRRECARWYTETVEADHDYAPTRGFENCPVPNAFHANWRTQCPKEQMDALKRRLKRIFDDTVDPQIGTEDRYHVKLKFSNFQDCKRKWNAAKGVPSAKVVYAGFKDNEDAEVVCKRVYPNSSVRRCPLDESCVTDKPNCYFTGVEPLADGTCSKSCGKLRCLETNGTETEDGVAVTGGSAQGGDIEQGGGGSVQIDP